jgi:hypothetical protein
MLNFSPVFYFALLVQLICGLSCARAGEGEKCADAAISAEADMALPAGLLTAIGRVESGRRDPATGAVLPWPWSINAAGRDEVFENADQAIRRTLVLLGQNVASIDVGCFQINLAAHPGAFPTLQNAFDPAANARAAGQFLLELRARLGEWPLAIAAYHSSTPALGFPYRDRVLAVWRQEATAMAPVNAGPPAPQGLRSVTWSASCCAVKVWTPTPQAGANIIVLVNDERTVAMITPSH